ncbi:hypothetical protein NYZ99_00780 [Maribacter litopenaei]|uniref:Uncharacterized protein n=1 Tax=Maribacter litopenaei TaxID=2976127 RepID=A0ABY5YA44_9FLAO|nr:hypothetical protein [Maribacter litopenaei]UWX55202.1 hypothetical protein NYZ99_00780 [Maribacter litopenaei]
MKTSLTKIAIFISLQFFISLSCSSEEAPEIPEGLGFSCSDGILNGNEVIVDCGGDCPGFCPLESIGILEGELVSDLQLDPAIEYRLRGAYLVRDRASLSIPAGTVIKADPGVGAYIAVAQGGTLNAFGQPENPVILTSGAENPAPGDWGGLVIHGKAPINTSDLGRSDILDIFYGGNELEDTSGVINYLRVEYAGAESDNEQNFDAVAFYGVGSFTTVTRLQTYKSLGNGFRFVGGNVNASWLVANELGGNGVELNNDWSGNGDSWFISGITKAGIKITSDSEIGIENPIETDTIVNVSIISPGNEGGLSFAVEGGNYYSADIFMSQLNLGFNIVGEKAMEQVDMGNLQLDSVQFDSPAMNFTTTNYTGSNTFFFNEATTMGAGNGALKPEWALGWTIGID